MAVTRNLLAGGAKVLFANKRTRNYIRLGYYAQACVGTGTGRLAQGGPSLFSMILSFAPMTTLTREEFGDLGVIAVANLFSRLYEKPLQSEATVIAKGYVEKFSEPVVGYKLTEAGIRAFEQGVRHYGQLVEHRKRTGGTEETTW